jgi:hypothetical protein
MSLDEDGLASSLYQYSHLGAASLEVLTLLACS